MGYLLIGYCNLYRMAGHKVRTAHDERLRLFFELRDHGADGDLCLLGRNLADFDIVLLAEILLDIVGKLVSGSLDALLLHNTSEGNDSYLGSTTSDIYDHVTFRSLDIESDTEGSSHRLVDKINIPSACMLGRVTHGPDLDFGTS